LRLLGYAVSICISIRIVADNCTVLTGAMIGAAGTSMSVHCNVEAINRINVVDSILGSQRISRC
jgi:hypothetical protein